MERTTNLDRQIFSRIIGRSPVFLSSIRQLPAIACSDASVLIEGETGTGKELIARAVHYHSNRAAFPFVAVNCGSLPDTLIEAELFGHERGAFTDAHASRRGLIAEAEGGTLFLDEIDTLPGKAQVGMLRLMQDQSYRLLGSTVERHADIRVLSATNTSLFKLAESGEFRVDLYYRLCVFCFHLPPLRERKEDIPILAQHFLRKHQGASNKTLALSEEAEHELMARDWPGNVRELENAIIRGIHLCSAEIIKASDLQLPPRIPPHSEGTDTVEPALRDFRSMKRNAIACFEREYLHRLMILHNGNVSAAARSAGKERRDLGRLLKKYDLKPAGFRQLHQAS